MESNPEVSHMEFHQEIDVSGQTCPLPILKAKKALQQLQSGQVLKVITTDPHAVCDFQAFCSASKNPLLAQTVENGKDVHYLARR